jgi:hypothetical protein
MTTTQEFLTTFLTNEQECGQIAAFSWFTYDGGQLGLFVACGDGYSTVTVEFPVDPDLWAFGANSQDAREEFSSPNVFHEMSPSDFRAHADQLDDLRRDVVHTLSRAMRAFDAPRRSTQD